MFKERLRTGDHLIMHVTEPNSAAMVLEGELRRATDGSPRCGPGKGLDHEKAR